MTHKKLTLRIVNKALKDAGHCEELVKGKGYCYFWEGDAPNWPQTMVYARDINQLNTSQWLSAHAELKSRAR